MPLKKEYKHNSLISIIIKMLIKIDYREIKLIQHLSGLIKEDDKDKIQMVSENLPLGDIILCDGLGQEKAIIERKSLADLAASIRDGRYKEQSFRLNQCSLHNHQIYYLVEGDLRYYKPYKGLPDKKALLSAMTSISFFKGFSLARTMNLEETAEWLLQFAFKLEKEGLHAKPFYLAGASASASASASAAEQAAEQVAEQAPANYAEVVPHKRIKKDNITSENIGEIMLAQIPSVSTTAAAAIMQKFSTFSALMTALQTDPHSLTAITTTNKNGQTRKLTKPCIQAIYDYLVKPQIIHIPEEVN
jgi:crossover junction endonuclease MUS81